MVISDSVATPAQRVAIRFVHEHGHECHALADGRIRLGIAATWADPTGYQFQTTELVVIKPDFQKVKSALGYYNPIGG